MVEALHPGSFSSRFEEGESIMNNDKENINRRRTARITAVASGLLFSACSIVYLSVFQPQPNSSIAIGAVRTSLTLPNFLSQFGISFRFTHSFHKIVVAAPRYTEERTHYGYWVLVTVTVNYCILCFRPHILSVDSRKSRNSLFSIRSRATSFCMSCRGG